MSNFRKFVLPRLLTKRPDPCNDGIARFDCNKLSLKDRIGHGSFGDVICKCAFISFILPLGLSFPGLSFPGLSFPGLRS